MKHEVKKKHKNGRDCIKMSLNMQRLAEMFPLLVQTTAKFCRPLQTLKSRFVNQSKGLSLNPGLQHIFFTITTIAIITRTILSGNETFFSRRI